MADPQEDTKQQDPTKRDKRDVVGKTGDAESAPVSDDAGAVDQAPLIDDVSADVAHELRATSWRGSDDAIQSVFSVVKAPLGWSIYSDGVKLGGVYGSKEAAFEAATIAAMFAVRDGAGVQINVPSAGEERHTGQSYLHDPTR